MTDNTTTTIERAEGDETQETYRFAGGLLGSAWEFPDGRVSTVESVTLEHESIAGDTLPYPELHFDHGPDMPADGFQLRIHPRASDIKPANEVARQITAQMSDEQSDQETPSSQL